MREPLPAARPRRSEFPVQPIEVVAVLAAVLLVAIHLVVFARQPESWSWATLLVVPLGLLGADFVSGVVHWAGDTWGDEATPGVGRRFLRPFRFHHAHPVDLLRSNFFTTNGDTALASLPVLAVPFLLPLDVPAGRWAAMLLASVGAWGMWTSQFHRWAHAKSPPAVVAWLQRQGLLLSRRHHLRHHRPPHTTNYCITTGWCDAGLSAVRFFPALEWVGRHLLGAVPRRNEANRPAG